jgi:hypothetical protein
VAGLADAEMRDQIVKQGAALAAEIASASERLAAEVDRSVERLDSEKVDATGLATLLDGVAAELKGGKRRTGKGGSRS